jgi:glycosyltransferase involved in cell wall biosynthesis
VSRILTVGVDASRAFVPCPTGTETYAARVIWHLARGPHRLRLYLRAPAARALPPDAEVRLMPWPRLWTHTRLAAEVRLHPPDVLFVPAHVLPLGVRVPTVVTVHDLGHRAYPEAHTWSQRAYLEWSARRHARLATRLVADSWATRDDLVRAYGVQADRIQVAPLGVDEDMRPADDRAVAAARAAAGVAEGRRYLLHVGTLQPRKNLTRLVEAWALAAPRYPDTDLVLAGKAGWGSLDLDALAREAGLSARVRTSGYVPRRHLAGLYSGAVALVHPSLYEGFGLTLVEAMACGTPVVASRCSSLPEVVGQAGVLFDPEDVAEMGRVLDAVLGDAALRRQLSAAGRQRSALFTWERCAAQVVSAIEAAAAAA